MTENSRQLKEAIEQLKWLNEQIAPSPIKEAIDTVIAEVEKPTYTADDMEAFAEFVGKFSTRKRTITYDTVSNKWFIKELKEGTLNTTFYTTAQLHELWEKERKKGQK